MRKNLLTPQIRCFEDQSLILVACGGFGRQVLHQLRQEFARLRLPADRVFFLAFDTEPAPRDGAAAESQPEELVHLDTGGTRAYVAGPENQALRAAVAHLPESALRDPERGCDGLPGLGFVTFHRYDETVITSRMRTTIETARARNPGGKIRCALVSGMGGGTASGMSVPFLMRVRDHLRQHKVNLDVFLATSESFESAPGTAVESLQRNCAASAMLWEQVLAGEREFFYPGKEGVREDRVFSGPSPQRTYVFSGGTGGTTSSPTVLASVVANCIAALMTTPLGSELERARARYTEDLLERTWMGTRDGEHPTALLTMNVAGLKADCFPSLFHLRAVRDFLDAVSRALPAEVESRVRANALACLEEARLTDDSIVADLGIGTRPLTREEVAAARVPHPKLHAFIASRLEEDVGNLVRLADGGTPVRSTDAVLEHARAVLGARAAATANDPEGFLPGAILFYRTVQKQLEANRQAVLERAALARAELGSTPSRERLDVLLERLRRDTVPGAGSRFGVVERFVATITVSVPTQVRKILEVATEIRSHAQVLAASTVLASIYERLARFCEQQREVLQGRLYNVNNLASLCRREEEFVQRSARAAFTYQRARFERLVEHLWEALRSRLPLPAAPEVIARLGGDLPAFLAAEAQVLDRLLEAVHVDLAPLAAAADEVMAADAMVSDALAESLAQFVPVVQVDRDRFAQLETARARYVLCTRRMYEAHRDGVFEGYRHLETNDPFNVLCTQHEEGLPFIALTHVRRTHDAYKVMLEEGRAALGHLSADLATSLPPLDS